MMILAEYLAGLHFPVSVDKRCRVSPETMYVMVRPRSVRHGLHERWIFVHKYF